MKYVINNLISLKGIINLNLIESLFIRIRYVMTNNPYLNTSDAINCLSFIFLSRIHIVLDALCASLDVQRVYRP